MSTLVSKTYLICLLVNMDDFIPGAVLQNVRYSFLTAGRIGDINSFFHSTNIYHALAIANCATQGVSLRLWLFPRLLLLFTSAFSVICVIVGHAAAWVKPILRWNHSLHWG